MNRTRALRPVETGPGVLVPPTADRRLAVEQWLADAHPRPAQVRTEWSILGAALLPLGTRFSAVRLPARLVLALTRGSCPSPHVDRILAEIFEGGPVTCNPSGGRYYVLVPPTMPVTWHQAADEWRQDDVECLGRDAYLGVPRLDRTADTPDKGWSSYWSVPMDPAGRLCAPLSVARLIAAARHNLGDDGPEVLR